MQSSNNSGCLSAIGYLIKDIVTRILGFLFIVFIYSAVVGIIDVISNIGDDNKIVNSKKIVKKKKTKPKKRKTPTRKKTTNNKVLSTYAYWSDNYGYTHAQNIRVKEIDYFSSVATRKSISSYDTWESMALKLIRNDRDRLNLIYNTFNSIRNNNNYTRYQFADIIVSFVQDIPYSLIPNPQDIYAPVEFMKKYTGDCDTRTVFLYIMLKKFNYDVTILNSFMYKHSILGINLATSGTNYKYYNGKRYYAWETTAKGYKRGWMPTKYADMNFWHKGL